MKNLHILFFAIIISITAFGQLDAKSINGSLVKLDDQLYASKYEVSNVQYTSYLNALKEGNVAQSATIAQIDTLNWKKQSAHTEAYAQYYHSHPAYRDYPVVNISYDAAVLFCEWLTERYNADPKRKFNKVLFRLPSEQEWINAAQAGNSQAIYGWEGNELRNNGGQIMGNFKRDLKDYEGVSGSEIEHTDVTAPVKSYWDNDLGMYNMSGNVAEMIQEKGIAKGGSWHDGSDELKVEAQYRYDGTAQTFVGFRYFLEVLEK